MSPAAPASPTSSPTVVTPYVSVATFFNPIIGTDANGDLFKPEEGVQYEAGIKYVPTFIDGPVHPVGYST